MVVTINLDYTAPVNPPGATPILTADQVWTGLQYKVRRPERFVPLITGCTVVSETTHHPSSPDSDSDDPAATIVRQVTFQPGGGPGNGKPVREVCKLYPPGRIDFLQEDGTSIGNYVRVGEDGGLLMTYGFEWRVEGVEEGEEEKVRELEGKYRQIAKTAVEGSIQTIRKIFNGEMEMD